MNERNKEKVQKILDLYEDICAADQTIGLMSMISVAACIVSVVLYPLALALVLPLSGLMGFGCWKIKIDQKRELTKLGLTSKELTNLCKSGEIDRIYNFIKDVEIDQSNDIEAKTGKEETFDYLPDGNKSISRTSIYLSKPKNNENDKSNEI